MLEYIFFKLKKKTIINYQSNKPNYNLKKKLLSTTNQTNPIIYCRHYYNGCLHIVDQINNIINSEDTIIIHVL